MSPLKTFQTGNASLLDYFISQFIHFAVLISLRAEWRRQSGREESGGGQYSWGLRGDGGSSGVYPSSPRAETAGTGWAAALLLILRRKIF